MSLDQSDEQAILEQALRFESPEERSAYLDGACKRDPQLRAQVESLIEAHLSAGGFLSAKAIGIEREAVPGTIIGRYKLLEKIGEGGMGVVYMAEQREPVTRKVALKVIKLGMDTKQVVARFEAERQALALMDHPNIAKVLDAGATDTGRPFFVMELVRGVPITEFCDKNQLPAQERIKLFLPVCQAIQSAHQKGVIHRDLKPTNILVTLNAGVPIPMVIDFGVAKATQQKLTEKTLFTQFAAMIGTPAYMSPEQAEMSHLDVDTRADIYGLGVLLYELLTGTTPFPEKRLRSVGYNEMQRIIVEEEPERPSTRVLKTPRGIAPSPLATLHSPLATDLDWIVMKCLEKDRARRYETANGLAMDLQRHLNNEPVVARPPSTAYRFRKLVQRNKLTFAATGAVAAALVLGLVANTLETVRAKRAERRAQLESERATHQERKATESEQGKARLLYAADMRLAQQAWEEGNLSRMAGLLDAHRPRQGGADQRGFEYFYFQHLANGEQEHVLHGHTNAVLGVAISRDGKWLASRTDTEIRLWDLASRSLARVLPISLTNRADLTPSEFASSISFSYDSRYLAIAADPGLQLFHIPTGQIRILSTERVGGVVFSPVTNWIAFSPPPVGDLKTRIWDYAVNKEVTSLRHKTVLCWSPDGSHILTGRWFSAVDSWDTATWTNAQTYSLGTSPSVAAISPEGHCLASADWQGSVHLLNTIGAKEIGALTTGDVQGSALAFSPDGKLLATGSPSQTILVWDVATLQLLRRLHGHKGKVTGVAFTPDGRMLASSAKDGDVMLWDVARQTGEARIANGKGLLDINSPRFSPDGKWLGLQTNRDTALLLESSSLRVSASLGGEIVAFSPDSGQLATLFNGSSPELRVWRVGALTNRAIIHLDALTFSGSSFQYSSTFSPQLSRDGTVIALCYLSDLNNDFTGWRMELFEAITGQRILCIDGHSFQNAQNHFLPDAPTWAYADGSKIKLWDLQSRTNTLGIECNATVYCFSISPDGMVLAAGQSDDLISIWNLKSNARVATLAGHQGDLTTLAFSPDGRTLASGSKDGTLKLWHLATYRELASFRQQQGVFWIDFSPDNQVLVAGGVDSYQVWRAPRDEAAAAPSAPKLPLADLPTNSVWRIPDGAAPLTPRMAAEEERCFTNLLKIHTAIMAYRKEHHQMPDWLGDLVPLYLSDTNCLLCPVQARTGLRPDLEGLDDLKIGSSYYYEFNARTNAFADPYGLGAAGDTMGQWKEKQLARYGPLVPVVRCRMHPHYLTVTFAGEKRLGGWQDWESAAERTRLEKQGGATNQTPTSL